MKFIAFLAVVFCCFSAHAKDKTPKYQVVQYVFKTTNSESSTPTLAQCRESEYYQATGIDAHELHGSSFQTTKLTHSFLTAKTGSITDGYGCLWYQGSGADLRAFIHFGMNTPIGTLKANGECLLIAYTPTSSGLFIESNCRLNIVDDTVAQTYGLTMASLVSTTNFRIDGPQVKGVSGSVWTLQSWGEPNKEFATFLKYRDGRD